MRTFLSHLGVRSRLVKLMFALVFFGPLAAFALDVVSVDFSPQSATSNGSSNSIISFSTGAAATGTTSYINKDNDSSTIGNYLRGYYHDSQFGFFKLDWSADITQNVRIVASTDKCASWYGYKFAGYAYSNSAGYIKFDYDNNVFVYYCESDEKLHGYSYSDSLGFQNFEGISFDVISFAQNNQTLGTGNDPFFVNNSSIILLSLPKAPSDIQGESVADKEGKESIFYIVK